MDWFVTLESYGGIIWRMINCIINMINGIESMIINAATVRCAWVAEPYQGQCGDRLPPPVSTPPPAAHFSLNRRIGVKVAVYPPGFTPTQPQLHAVGQLG